MSEPNAQKAKKKPARPRPAREPHPLLHRLAELHPALFGARLRPLKVGTYEELVERHPDLDRDQLKAALAWHARSTRYLDALAAGEQRHDLEGRPAEPLAPEHRHYALLEVYRRRQAKSKVDLRHWLVDRLVEATSASGLDRTTYLQRVGVRDAFAVQAVQDAFDILAERAAKKEALKRAYQASGKSVAEFAEMYGLDLPTVQAALL